MTTLDPNDLNFEHLRSFDGTTVYAQNKVHCCNSTNTLLILQDLATDDLCQKIM